MLERNKMELYDIWATKLQVSSHSFPSDQLVKTKPAPTKSTTLNNSASTSHCSNLREENESCSKHINMSNKIA